MAGLKNNAGHLWYTLRSKKYFRRSLSDHKRTVSSVVGIFYKDKMKSRLTP